MTTGGLVALLYGWETIPGPWIEGLARVRDIEALAERCARLYG